MSDLTLTQRELDEIELAMYYDARLQHGTAGHNRLLLIAKLAKALGFSMDAPQHDMVDVPDGVTVEKPVVTTLDGVILTGDGRQPADKGLRQDENGVTTLDGVPLVPSMTSGEGAELGEAITRGLIEGLNGEAEQDEHTEDE